jgi:hypothetical protein
MKNVAYRRPAALFVCVMCAVALVDAKNPGTQARGLSVTSTFGDGPGDAIQSDGRGPYVDTEQSVQSELLDNREGNLALDTNTSSKSPLRTARLLLGQQLATGTLTRVPTCTSGTVTTGCTIALDGLLITRSVFFDSRDNLRTMQVGQVVPKNLVVDWYDGNTPYRLRYEGQNGAAFANFTCEATDAAGCSQWFITVGDWGTREQAGTGNCPAGAYNCFSAPLPNTHANLYRMNSSLSSEYLVKTVDAPFTMTINRP